MESAEFSVLMKKKFKRKTFTHFIIYSSTHYASGFATLGG